MIEKEIRFFQDSKGDEPFMTWLNTLDKDIQRRIKSRIARLELGNFGDYKRLTGGILELRFMFGSGYRVYFAEENDIIVILLCGGDKKTQGKDIIKAINYWQEYKENKHGRLS
jgi:putative addiction module killer protein